MANFKKILLLLIITGIMIISGCSGSGDSNDITVIENYAGSGGPGDFYRVDINITDKEYSYENVTTGSDSGWGTFDPVSVSGNTGVYRLDTGDLFVKLEDEMVVVANNDSNPGERLTVALKEASSSYGDEIAGTYNLATSMEGAIGEVVIDAGNKLVDIKIDLNGDGDYNDSEEQLNDMSYTYNENYKAIELIESNEFKHYGVFINDDISVWDSYYWNGTDWQGDGMSIMVRKDTLLELSQFAAEYNYLDVDGYSGTFELVDIGSTDTELELVVDGEETGITITESNIDERGIINLTADLVEPEGVMENWYMMVLPGKVLIVASADDNAFEGDGGFAVGIQK